jgi:7-cyano-7-deazaguanine reductase
MEKLSKAEDLKSLGSNNTKYKYEDADPKLLEYFPNPMNEGPDAGGTVHIEAPEFTSLCPKTGQPDFAKIVIDYEPRERCVESKSLKLYLGSYRNFGEFHESCVRRIVNDLVNLLDPVYIKVVGEFTPRGGIPFWPTVEYYRPSALVPSVDLVGVDDPNRPEDGFYKRSDEDCNPLFEKQIVGFTDEDGNIETWGRVLYVTGNHVYVHLDYTNIEPTVPGE